jgi:hypothetical protein
MHSPRLLPSRLFRSFRQLDLRATSELNPWCSIPCAHTVRVPTSTLGKRMLAVRFYREFRAFSSPLIRPKTSTEPTGKKTSHIPSSFRLRTLRPERLSVVGQEVVDLSGKLSPVVPFINGRKLKYMYETTPRLSFPINTRGFFYYHMPTDGPELYAGVRFRICDSPEAFEHGRDLLDPRGDVWGPKILELIKNREKEGFLALLRAENLIDEALIHDINKLDLTQNVRRSQYSLFAPFYLNLALAKRQLTYVTRAKVIVLHFPGQVTTNYSTKCPLTGPKFFVF